MTVSAISGVTVEGQPQELASFLRSGVLYVVWHSPNSLGQKKIRWKPHTSLDFTEVIADSLTANFRNISALYHPSSDSLVVSWDDGLWSPGISNSTIYCARFNIQTGEVLNGPTVVGAGTRPQMMYQNNVPGDVFFMFSFLAKTDGVTIRSSSDGGLSWGDAAPVLTNRVARTTFVEAVAYGPGHVSIAQLGSDPRALAEFGILKRTRPLVAILNHPSDSSKLYIGEPSRLTAVPQIDNLRGGMALSADGASIFKIDGEAQGSSDSVGGIALLTKNGSGLTVTASAGPTTGTSRNRIVQYSLTPGISASADLDVGLPAVSMAVSATYAYLAQNLESNPVAGQLKVIQLSSLSTQSAFLSGVSGRAIAVARFASPNLIFAATTESSVERLRVYEENGTTPTLLANFKLPLRANSLSATTHPSNPSWALVYASTAERLCVLEYRGASSPLRLVNSFTLVGGGQFYGLKFAANGNVIAAAGSAGILVISPNGRTLAQLRLSGQVLPEWSPSTAYSLGALVRTRAQHQFSANRAYFRVSSAGTSSAMEPSWASSGTIQDGTVQWQYVGLMDGVATDVALDDTGKKIYAVGSAGGDLGTDGRVWVLDARGLL